MNKDSYYFAFDTKKITRGSLKERYEAYKIASDTGWMTISNALRKTDGIIFSTNCPRLS